MLSGVNGTDKPFSFAINKLIIKIDKKVKVLLKYLVKI